MKLHPQTIVDGYRLASKKALQALESAAVDHGYVWRVSYSFRLCNALPRTVPILNFLKRIYSISLEPLLVQKF